MTVRVIWTINLTYLSPRTISCIIRLFLSLVICEKCAYHRFRLGTMCSTGIRLPVPLVTISDSYACTWDISALYVIGIFLHLDELFKISDFLSKNWKNSRSMLVINTSPFSKAQSETLASVSQILASVSRVPSVKFFVKVTPDNAALLARLAPKIAQRSREVWSTTPWLLMELAEKPGLAQGEI